MPSLPPAICNTTRMDESLPVAICVALSAASAWSAVKVFERNVGTVHESAPVRTVRRRNSRRVWRVISFFILRHLIFRCAHHEPDGITDVALVDVFFAVEIFAKRLFLLRLKLRLQQSFFQGGD